MMYDECRREHKNQKIKNQKLIQQNERAAHSRNKPRSAGDARRPHPRPPPSPAEENLSPHRLNLMPHWQDGTPPIFIPLTYAAHVALAAPKGPRSTQPSPTQFPALERGEAPSFERFE